MSLVMPAVAADGMAAVDPEQSGIASAVAFRRPPSPAGHRPL